MEWVTYILMLFVFLNCIFKLSLWKWWHRCVYSVLLAVGVWLSMDAASGQSKTEMAAWLQDTSVMQNVAVLVTIESVVCVMFCFSFFARSERKGIVGRRRWNEWVWKCLFFYPGLMLIPVLFYLQSQLLFVAVGIPFSTTTAVLAVGVALLLPLLSEGVRRLLSDEQERVELHLLLSLFVCVLGLMTTQTRQMVYAGRPAGVAVQDVVVVLATGAFLFALGWILERLTANRRRTVIGERKGK
ncbi:MAG: hypothetical protein IJ684_04900 [Bacteroidales bacterium]|nr:hypothetical protein [Bacteroidales bacterium]